MNCSKPDFPILHLLLELHDTCQIIMLYTLNLYSDICQYISIKLKGKKISRSRYQEELIETPEDCCEAVIGGGEGSRCRCLVLGTSPKLTLADLS